MHKRIVIVAGWITLLSALLAMIIGHTGSPNLSWETNQISTYAALAPHDKWITASMLLAGLTLACIAVLTSRYGILGTGTTVHAAPMLAGAAIAGLLLLAGFEETAATIRILKHAGFDAIRQQSFHDAGLLIFFYSSIALALMLGMLTIIRSTRWKGKALGLAVGILAAAAYPLMTTDWPNAMGVLGAGPGLQQRASLFSLWLAIALVLLDASGKTYHPAPMRQRG